MRARDGDDFDGPRGHRVERKPKTGKKIKSPLWAKLILTFGIVLVLASGGSLIAADYVLGQVEDSVEQESMLGDSAVQQDSGKPKLDGPLNLLLIGVDERTVQDDPEGTRADTIIVMHINAAHDKAYMLSVPRDSLVQIPAFPKTHFKGAREKINAAFQHGSDNGGGRSGGFELLATTVSKVTGISFNAGAIVNFAGFQSVVEALGGIDMCVDQKVTSIHLDRSGQPLHSGATPMTYNPGCRHMVPWQALDFVRQRHTSGGDYDRQRHQQQFLKAVAKAAVKKGLTDATKLNGILKSVGKTLTVDPGGAALSDWIFILKAIDPNGMAMLRTNGGKYASVKCPDGSSCQTLTKTSLDMFTAAKSDSLDTFIDAHPTWVAKDKQG